MYNLLAPLYLRQRLVSFSQLHYDLSVSEDAISLLALFETLLVPMSLGSFFKSVCPLSVFRINECSI